MMAALAARAAARKAQEEDAAITECSLAAAPSADDTGAAEADEVEADVADLDLPTTEPELQDGDEGAEAVEMGEQETVESDPEDTAVEEPAEVEEDVRAEASEVPTAVEPLWPEDSSTWHGEYFNNMTLVGEPVLVREDAEIDFDWGTGSPAPEIDDDGFSVRWTRTATLRPGLYRFTVTSDDGARLWVNERLVISAWYDHTEMTFRREMELPGGPVDLRLEYYEKSMLAMVRVSWEKIG
jgi:hypothetical protein